MEGNEKTKRQQSKKESEGKGGKAIKSCVKNQLILYLLVICISVFTIRL